MLRRIGGLSGLFVLLTLGWYLVFPFITGCDPVSYTHLTLPTM